MDEALQEMVAKWDHRVDFCFFHVTKKDAVRAGTEQELGISIGEGGMIHTSDEDSLSTYTAAALEVELVQKSVHRVAWTMKIGDLSKKVWTVMLHVPGKSPDPILLRYAPEHARPDKFCFHFFSSKRARSLDPFAEEVD